MIRDLFARLRSWISVFRSRRKKAHRLRQKGALRRHSTLSSIEGDTPGETFARRLAYLRKIDPLVFEELVLDAFARQGWTIERGTRYSGDGGLDGKVYRNGEWFGIQCKRYQGAIHSEHVHLLASDLRKFGLQRGFFVHTGRTPKSKERYPAGIRLISGQRLIEFLLGTLEITE